MSQEYFPSDSADGQAESSKHHEPESLEFPPHDISTHYRPQLMTVGSGAQSHHATELIEQLERDSGYGSSIAGDPHVAGGDMRAWREELLQDRPTPIHTPRINGESSAASENERRILASHVHQLYYNQNRVALAKAIGQTVELLKDLQQMNSQWPAHYPSVQRPEFPALTRPTLKHISSTRTGTNFSASSSPQSTLRPIPPKRAETSLGESSTGETSAAAENRKPPEPRLITPQIAQEFSILKLDLKLGAVSQAELVHSLEKGSIASLLDGKISQSIRHLLSLRDRIEDTSSKVLVTGDLNAGKSTFCNALLRRKILPEDQQPCTGIFCEVLDARENGGLEEVHAVHKDQVYNRHDESTYDAYSLQELEKIVTDNDRYMQCKVYVKDSRTIDESLLNNGVVDIALIDAPGLNSDSVKTTAVFARQEEIDVVVFVVSAANHFTLSATDFIWQAAHEKAYIFMVVNGFDNIRDKEKCQRRVLEQIARMSPRTFKEASELVHFVSSNAIPVAPLFPTTGSNAGGDGGGGGPPGPPDDDLDDQDVPIGKHGEPGSPGKGKGKEKDTDKIQDFGKLESALRRFVLEKRARSKLAPAKTYLLNCLGDIHVLATVNRDVAQSELDRVSKELSEIEPAVEDRQKHRIEVSDQVEKDVDAACTDVYNYTRDELSRTINHVGAAKLGVEYPGIWSAFQFAEDLKAAMLDQIAASVKACEDHGRARSVQGVNMIKTLGLLHIGDIYDNFSFKSDMMFQRRKDALARCVETDVELLDFFDIGGLWERQEKVVGTGMAMTVVGTLGTRAIGGIGWVDGAFGAVKVMGSRNMRHLILPGIVAAGKPGSKILQNRISCMLMIVLAALTVAYILSSIPTSLPPRLARKLSANLASIDYTHSNANRISSEVRRVLRYPAQHLTVALQRGVEELQQKKEEVSKIKHESQVARKYFANLVRESGEGRRRVEAVDLEGPLPGAAASYVDQ
jgi:mitofusin 2